MTCLTPACNEEVSAANQAVMAGSFSILQADSFEVPYGEYPHSVGMQVFDREAAQMMANELSSLLGKLSRGFRGVPVYAGHPDHPDAKLAAQYPDRRARGWIKEIIPGDASARFVVSYNELGRSEVEDAQWAGYSPLWLMRPIPAANGKPGMRFRPAMLKSVALTNNPNIPVPPLIAANEDSPHPSETPPMKPTLKAKLLQLLGLAEDVDDDTFDTAANQYCDTELARRAAAKDNPEKKDDGPPAANEAVLSEMRLQIEGAVAAANQAAAELRATRVDFALEQLVNSGRLPAADRDATRARLLAAANDAAITSEISTLMAAKPRLQTSATHTQGLAAQRPAVAAANEAEERQRLRNEAVEQVRQAQPGVSATVAWGIAASRNPDLFSH